MNCQKCPIGISQLFRQLPHGRNDLELLRYALGSTIALFGLYVITLSYIRLLTNFHHGRKGTGSWSSPVPLLGPCALVLGSLVLPLHLGWWVLFAFLVDPDTIITFASLTVLAWKLRRDDSKDDT